MTGIGGYGWLVVFDGFQLKLGRQDMLEGGFALQTASGAVVCLSNFRAGNGRMEI